MPYTTAIVVEDFTTIVSGASTVTVSIPNQGPFSGMCIPAQLMMIIPSFQSGIVSASGALLGVFAAASGIVNTSLSSSLSGGASAIWQWTGSSQSGPAFQPPNFIPAVPITCQSGIVASCAAGINMAVIWTPA